MNSDQAVRIRTLEAEQSRLLSENITLREANIHLSHELNKGRSALALENVGNVRHKLELFAAGLGGLLAELADAQTNLPEPVPVHESAKRRSPKSSPSQRWRSGTNLAHLGSDEGRLSPIVEGKHYPRKTLDLADLAVSDDQETAMSDSPDLGPPPVVRYDMGDPVKNSPSPSRTRDLRAEYQEEEPRDPFINLETRKKRRSSIFSKDAEKAKSQDAKSDTDQPDLINEDKDAVISAVRMVKVGGKRKLEMREDDEVARMPEDFEFTKKNSEAKSGSKEKSTKNIPIRGSRPPPEVQGAKSIEHPTSKHKKLESYQLAPLRRVLGDKSVNTDPVLSPAKNRSRDKGEKEEAKNSDAIKKDVVKPRPTSRPRSAASIRGNPETSQRVERVHLRPSASAPEVAEISLEPATPSAANLLSPIDGSAPSTSGSMVPQDTPEPSEFGVRPSRRSRPAVSYAEPKLNVKMRRPGKELVDAVADDKTRKSISLSSSMDTSSDRSSTKLDTLPNWAGIKAEPMSPLAPKQAQTDEKETSTSGDKERRPMEKKAPSPQTSDQAALMEEKINAIVNISNRRISRAREAAENRSQTTEDKPARSEQNVFDFIETSSPEVSLASHTLTGRKQRRASSVEKLGGKTGSDQSSGRSDSRRRETMATNASLRRKDDELEEGHDEDLTSRGARMATRRKSMMI